MGAKQAKAVAHGAATIINAIATGSGAAFGVDLWTQATVKLTDEPHVVTGKILSDANENTALIEHATRRALKHFGAQEQFGAKIVTESNIPVARGLKSSSAAANATVLATIAALGEELDDLSVVRLGVDAAFDAKVTVTGAFDDACASYFGGAVVTDNLARELVSRVELPEDLQVLFYVPAKKAYTINSDVAKLKTVAPLVQVAYKEALNGNFWTALSLNGLIYSSALGFDVSVALAALDAGAVAAGLCGKGPSVTAVVSKDTCGAVRSAFEGFDGEVVLAGLNSKKAQVVG
ncbi:MAG: shikimate kinase [Candidatus Bathyarchaeota archaeon]|nr:shikimate kinase [Candidatus Bathyarchaeota archaeon]